MPRFTEPVDLYYINSGVDHICTGSRNCKNRSYDPDKDICNLCMKDYTRAINDLYLNQLDTWYTYGE